MRFLLLGLAVAAAALLVPASQPAAAGGRTIVVKTDVSIEKVGNDLVFPFDRPEPGEGVFFRVSAENLGPATARKGEILVVAEVFSNTKPTIRGRRGLRCEVGRSALAWLVRCRNSLVFRSVEDPLSVLIRVEADGPKVWVRAGTGKAPDVDSDLVVKSKKDRATIDVAVPVPFSITSVSLPSFVLSNGPREDLVVSWAGSPTFPVTLVYAPDSCPSNVNCTTPRMTFAQETNPLRFVDSVWCAGSFTNSIFFDYSVHLVDANGVMTPKANADFTCRPF